MLSGRELDLVILYLIKSQAVVAGVGGGEAGGDVSTHYGAYLQ